MRRRALAERLFVALALPVEVRAALVAHLDGVAIPGRVVPPENWHLTLRFVGSVDEVGRDLLAAALDQADLGRRFRAGFGGLGAFPRPQRATVVWLGIERGSSAVEALAAAIEDAVQGAGFAAEERPFHPHLTLSRVRPPQDVGALLDAVPPCPARLDVSEVVLFRSHTSRDGAVYEPVERFELT